MFSYLFLFKVLGISSLLLYGGCKIRGMLHAKRDLGIAQTKIQTLEKQVTAWKEKAAKARDSTDKSVTEALAKCDLGKEIDADKKNYKLTAKNCRTILRREAEEIANKTKRMLQ